MEPCSVSCIPSLTLHLLRTYSSGPPVSSVAEAHNLPTSSYNNRWNQNAHRHQAPQPSIPRIFPWEFEYRAPATRVWNEVWTPTPPPAPEPVYEAQEQEYEEEVHQTEEEETADEQQTEDERIGESSTYETEDEEVAHSPTTPTAESGPKWGAYDRRNAWDTVEGIHEYVSLLQSRGRSASRSKKGGHHDDDDDDDDDHRRYAFPITPNPLRTRPVWNSGTRYDKIFPSAPGVPAQGEWVSSSTDAQV